MTTAFEDILETCACMCAPSIIIEKMLSVLSRSVAIGDFSQKAGLVGFGHPDMTSIKEAESLAR